MLLWRLIITYQGCVRRYCSKPPLVFSVTKCSKVAQKATYDTSQCRRQARATLRAESLLIFRILPCKRATYTATYKSMAMYIHVLCTYTALRVMHFSAFILMVNNYSMCIGGQRLFFLCFVSRSCGLMYTIFLLDNIVFQISSFSVLYIYCTSVARFSHMAICVYLVYT